MSGDEHPSGLRDAIAEAVVFSEGIDDMKPPLLRKHVDGIEFAVRAWLSVVSEGEIEAAARAMYERPGTDRGNWKQVSVETKNIYRLDAKAALAASREVLIPKEQ